MENNERTQGNNPTLTSVEGDIAELRSELEVYMTACSAAERESGSRYSETAGRLAVRLMRWFAPLISHFERRAARDRGLRAQIEEISNGLVDGTLSGVDAAEELRKISHNL